MKRDSQFHIGYLSCFVRLIGLEPTQLALLDPKSSASTNFATGAGFECRKLNNSSASQCSLFEIAGAKVVIFSK